MALQSGPEHSCLSLLFLQHLHNIRIMRTFSIFFLQVALLWYFCLLSDRKIVIWIIISILLLQCILCPRKFTAVVLHILLAAAVNWSRCTLLSLRYAYDENSKVEKKGMESFTFTLLRMCWHPSRNLALLLIFKISIQSASIQLCKCLSLFSYRLRSRISWFHSHKGQLVRAATTRPRLTNTLASTLFLRTHSASFSRKGWYFFVDIQRAVPVCQKKTFSMPH